MRPDQNGSEFKNYLNVLRNKSMYNYDYQKKVNKKRGWGNVSIKFAKKCTNLTIVYDLTKTRKVEVEVDPVNLVISTTCT